MVAGRRRRAARDSDRARVLQSMFAAESGRRGRWALPDLDPTDREVTVIPWWTDRMLRQGEVRGERPAAVPRRRQVLQSTGPPVTGVKRAALLAARSGGDQALRTLARVQRCELGELWQRVCDFDADYG